GARDEGGKERSGTKLGARGQPLMVGPSLPRSAAIPRLGRRGQTGPSVTDVIPLPQQARCLGARGPAGGIKAVLWLLCAAVPALPGYPRGVSMLAVVGAGPKGIAIA